jgi:hypothetical protein
MEEHPLRFFIQSFHPNLFQVEDNFGNILEYSLNCLKFMENIGNLNANNSGARDRGKQNSPE